MIRIGHGFDVHKFGGQGPITICGIKLPYMQGLIAHSDGDVALHAVCDAILGALALGDIGNHFPDNDAKYEGIDSRELVVEVMQLAIERDYRIGNIDITIAAEQPKMAPHIQAMRSEIAKLLQTDVENVNVKATTTEKLGYVGRGEGISTHAVVLLFKKSEQ